MHLHRISPNQGATNPLWISRASNLGLPSGTAVRQPQQCIALLNYEKVIPYVAQWLRCCATNQKVAGSIPACVSEFFIDIKSFRLHYGPGVDSASNRNEYQEYFMGVKAAGA